MQVFKMGSYSIGIGIPEKNMTVPTIIHIVLNHKIPVINREYYQMALQYIAYAHLLGN